MFPNQCIYNKITVCVYEKFPGVFKMPGKLNQNVFIKLCVRVNIEKDRNDDTEEHQEM